MNNEVKHYWPEEIVGTGELVVYLQDYAALEAENARLREILAAVRKEFSEAIHWEDMQPIMKQIDATLAPSTGQEVE